MTSRRTFIVYREDLLGASETFVRAQSESLEHFDPFYVGLRQRSGLSLPKSKLHIVGGSGLGGKLKRARYKLLGPTGELHSMLAAKHPVLVHAHFGCDGCNAMALARGLRLPLIVTFHGYDVTVDDTLLPRLYLRRRELLKAQAAKFICVSEFIRDRAIAKGFPADKLVVHYTGIDVDLFRAEPIIQRSPAVLFVGRLVVKKGCEYLIRAMARVQQVMPEATLVVIGEGPLREQLERKAAALLKNFEFLGEQDSDAVRNWMNRAMVLSTPSVIAESGDAEGFGMIFAEAQAMGLPVVSFATGGIPEAIADQQTGFLVKARDEESLTIKLLLLLNDSEVWARMSQAGQSRARLLFNIRKQAVILEKIYEGVLAEWSSKIGLLNIGHAFDRRYQHTDSTLTRKHNKESAVAQSSPRNI
jgi:colanic acid/amylovoran biosynthesis glycosyltransferase